jgi:hypothetical protein
MYRLIIIVTAIDLLLVMHPLKDPASYFTEKRKCVNALLTNDCELYFNFATFNFVDAFVPLFFLDLIVFHSFA